MMDKVLIITGGSRGIGEALVKEYQKNGYKVLSLSRTVHEKFVPLHISQIRIDLRNLHDVEGAVDYIFKDLDTRSVKKITLINNAGTLGVIGPIEKSFSADIQSVIDVNLGAPAVLSAAFIRKTKKLDCDKRIINISSGASTKPYFGWSLYCATKAGLEMLTKSIANEQADVENGVKCIAVIPGVVDTEMQDLIRETDESDFKAVQRFIDLKNNQQLSDPAEVAKRIFKVDQNTSIGNGEIVSVREN